MIVQLPHTTRELHHRSNDGIEVRMLWREHDGHVLVAVADGKTGEGFAVEVREGDRPLDVFNHPFAYAAWRGIEAASTSPAASTALAA